MIDYNGMVKAFMIRECRLSRLRGDTKRCEVLEEALSDELLFISVVQEIKIESNVITIDFYGEDIHGALLDDLMTFLTFLLTNSDSIFALIERIIAMFKAKQAKKES